MGKKRVSVVIVTVVHGNLKMLAARLSAKDQNIFIIPATDRKFLQVTLRSLELLARHYPLTVVGHPNWEKVTFLKADLLQHVNAVITSSDRVDYHSANMVKFLRAYRAAYRAEPGEYAIKGFDEGMYFGRLAARSTTRPLQLKNERMLHNTFHFEAIPGQGWVNTHVNLYKYVNFELKPVE